MTREIETSSSDETEDLGRALGERLRGGEVIALSGDLGAGKTCLVRGIAAGLAIPPELVYSPTFTLIAEHMGRIPFHHVDVYRLAEPISPEDLEELGVRELLEPQGATAIEWYEKLERSGAGKPSLRIEIAIGSEDRRRIRLAAESRSGAFVLEALSWP